MNSLAPVSVDYPEVPNGDVDSYLTNIDNVYGINDPFDYSTLSNVNSLSFDPVLLENGLQLSFDGSNYSDYSGSVYSSSCYGTNDSTLYCDLTSSLYSNALLPKSELDLNKFSLDHKYSFDNKFRADSKYSLDSLYSVDNKYGLDTKYSLESTEMLSHTSTPNLPYLTPKIKPKFEYMNPISSSTTSTISSLSSSMPAMVNNNLGNMGGGSMNSNIMELMSPRPHHLLKVTTHDLAMFNSLMDGSALTPIRNNSLLPANLRKTKSLPIVLTPSAVALKDFKGFYHFEDKQSGSPYLRHPPASQKHYNYENEFTKSVDSLMSFPSDRNVSTTSSPVHDVYSSSERSVGNYQNNNYQFQKSAYQETEIEEMGEAYYTPTSVTANVTIYSVPTYDPNLSSEERYKEIMKAVMKLPPSTETFLSPMTANIINSYSIKELGSRYDESQRTVVPSQTHVVYVRNNSEMNLVLRNDNLLVQHSNKDKNEKLKMSKQVLSSKDVASSSDLNESMARSRNDEQGMSYLPFVSCNWKGIHETSWWMGDSKGIVRNFKVKFDPAVFGSKNTAFEEATKFGKFVEGMIRPGTLISWYPGFNIPIGTSGRANLRKVLHMDRMKNSELCDPVLEANGLKVAAKSTFGDMIIVELYKAAYLLGLWDVAAYNCLKTCKRRGYSFEWIHNIQASGKRITLDALKYMRNVKEIIEQDKISRVNSEKKRRRRKANEKRRKVTVV